MDMNQKIDKIYDMVHDQNVKLATHIERQEAHAKMLLDHKDKIEELEAHKNKTYGFAAVISIFLTAVGHVIAKLFHL